MTGKGVSARRPLPPGPSPETRRRHCPLSAPSSTQATERCPELPPWQLPEALPHRCLFYNRPHY